MWDDPSETRSDIFSWADDEESDDSGYAGYDVTGRIRGGSQPVYKARSGEAGDVALMRAPSELAKSDWQVADFLERARASKKLEHPNIARLVDFGESEGRYFVALEYVNGRDLDQIQRRVKEQRKRLPIGMAVQVVIGICDALVYAQGAKDDEGRPLASAFKVITPRNVLVSRDGEVKLLSIDVGTAAPEDVRAASYAAPELTDGRVVDQRAALFSVGVILYELATGMRLFTGATEREIRRKIKQRDVQPPSSVVRVVPKALDDIIMCALAFDPDERYYFAAEIRAELESFAHASGLKYTQEQVGRWMKATIAADDGQRANEVVQKLRGPASSKGHLTTSEPQRRAPVRPQEVQDAAARARQVIADRRAGKKKTSEVKVVAEQAAMNPVVAFRDPHHGGLSALDRAMKQRRETDRTLRQMAPTLRPPSMHDAPESSIDRLRRVIQPVGSAAPPVQEPSGLSWMVYVMILLAVLALGAVGVASWVLLDSDSTVEKIDINAPMESPLLNEFPEPVPVPGEE